MSEFAPCDCEECQRQRRRNAMAKAAPELFEVLTEVLKGHGEHFRSADPALLNAIVAAVARVDLASARGDVQTIERR